MIQELTDNEIFSNEYRNIAPKAGDLAAVFEKNGRNLLMRLDTEGAMSLPEAVLFADYWFDPEDTEADKKAAEKGGRLVYLFSVGTTCYYSFVYTDGPAPDFSFTGMEFLPFSFESKPLPKNIYFCAETAFQLSSWYNGNRHCGEDALCPMHLLREPGLPTRHAGSDHRGREWGQPFDDPLQTA